jgi:hypothetical protein
MAVVTHGVSTDSADRLLVNAGAVYLGFHDATSPGTLLGATKGGNTFEVAQTIRDIRPDGSKGPIKGLRRIEEVIATLKINMLEFTAENLRRGIAGAAYTSGTTTITTEATGTGNAAQVQFPLGLIVEDCEDAWNEGVVANVTSTLDGAVFATGAGSAKFEVAAGFTTGRIGYETVSIVGNTLAAYQALAVWVKSSVAVAAGQLQIMLDDTALCASPLVTVNLPAIPAAVWTLCIVPTSFAACASKTVISVGVNATADIGAFDLNIDSVRAVHNPIEQNSETITVAGGAVVRGTDYSMDYDKGVVQFHAAPAGAAAVVVTYKYVGGGVMSGAEIASGSYVDNVTLVMKLSGYTNPAIFRLNNCLMTTPFPLAGNPKDEVVSALTFMGHYAVGDLSTMPWSVEYPAS